MTQSNKPDLGMLVKLEGRDAVRYERVYPHAKDRVWRALIDPASIKAWFPTAIEGLTARRTGEKLRFIFPGEDGPTLHGELRASEPQRLLEYTWGEELLRFELSATGPSDKHTKLVFTVTVSERSQAPRDATGWHMCLENLRRNLQGEAAQAAGAKFTELTTEYLETLGSDFPRFLKGDADKELARVLPADGLEGQLFKSDSGVSLVLVRAAKATEITHRDLPRGGYLSVIEGTLELHLGGHEVRFTRGMEFHIPEGAHVRGRLDEGTRLLFAASEPDVLENGRARSPGHR